MHNLLLSGEADNSQQTIADLESRVMELESELQSAREETAQVRRDATRAVLNLRRQLSPLFNALKAVFGELDAIGGEDNAAAGQPNVQSSKAGVWETWKRKLGGKQAEFIQALLEHGEMSAIQLKIATHSGQQTVYEVTSKLYKLGLINKNGGKYSLKQL